MLILRTEVKGSSWGGMGQGQSKTFRGPAFQKVMELLTLWNSNST